MKKKIGLLTSSLIGGGAERVVAKLSLLLSTDYDVSIILYDTKHIEYKYYGEIINMTIPPYNGGIVSKLVLLVKRMYKLKRIKKRNKFNLVISFLDTPNIINVLSKTKPCKTILSVRNYPIIKKNQTLTIKLTNIVMKYMYRRADKIITVSRVINLLLRDSYNINLTKIKTIYNPYDLPLIKKSSLELIDKQYIEFMSSEKVFVAMGRMVYQKGFWHLIKAFKIVNDKDNETKLVILGIGEQEDKIRNLILELKLDKSILLTGFKNNPYNILKNGSIFILTSLFEGLSNAILEAMACGCMVISTDCKAGPHEIMYKIPDFNKICNDITEADYGILIPPLETEEIWNYRIITKGEYILAEAMLKYINNKELLEKYRNLSVERVEYFSNERCKREYINIIEKVK